MVETIHHADRHQRLVAVELESAVTDRNPASINYDIMALERKVNGDVRDELTDIRRDIRRTRWLTASQN